MTNDRFNDVIRIVTHGDTFHADDAFAVATLRLLLKGKHIDIVRTRDPEIIAMGDYVVDVGGEYDVSRKRFDHHQTGGAGSHASGIPYAAFGLVWKEYGKELCGSETIANAVEKRLVEPIDAMDNGVSLCNPVIEGMHPYNINTTSLVLQPTWKEDVATIDDIFINTYLPFVTTVLEREIIFQQHKKEAEDLVMQAYEQAPNKRIIELDKDYPWYEIMQQYPEPLYIVAPRSNGMWKVKCVHTHFPSFEYRKLLPSSWSGKRYEALQKETGVQDAVFCHNARFLAVAQTKEGAHTLATLALDHNET